MGAGAANESQRSLVPTARSVRLAELGLMKAAAEDGAMEAAIVTILMMIVAMPMMAMAVVATVRAVAAKVMAVAATVMAAVAMAMLAAMVLAVATRELGI